MHLISDAGATQAIGKSPTYFNGNVIWPREKGYVCMST